MFVPAIYTPCRFAEVCARTSITSICTRCDTRCGGPFARPATKRFPLPGRAIRRMSTWRVASAALFGEADLNAKKGRTPSTKVQGIRGLKSSGTQDESSGESFLKDSGEKAERAWESTKESAKDTGEKVERAWESTKESVSDAFTSAGEAISDKFRDLTGQKSAQEKAGDKAGEAVEHLKETGQSVKKGLENAAEAVSDKFKES